MSDEDKEQEGAVDHQATDTSVDGGGHGRLASLAGFLFGNIDDAGRLVDDDILDEECRQHLEGLEALGAINSMVEEITDESEVVRSVAEKIDASAGGSDGESADIVPFTPLADDTSRVSYIMSVKQVLSSLSSVLTTYGVTVVEVSVSGLAHNIFITVSTDLFAISVIP
jgi:TATA box-binding protein binding